MDHYRHPRNRGELEDADVVRRGSNPRCGDDIEVGVRFDGDRLARVGFRGRGCAICLASASMMTEAVTGRTRTDARELCDQLSGSMAASDGESAGLPETLRPLASVRAHAARRRCVLLAWQALEDALG
jgi:nitrogen fixation NifU-like protein